MAQHTKLCEALRLSKKIRVTTNQQRPSGTIEGERLSSATFTVLSGCVQAHFAMLDITSLRLYYLKAELHRHAFVIFRIQYSLPQSPPNGARATHHFISEIDRYE